MKLSSGLKLLLFGLKTQDEIISDSHKNPLRIFALPSWPPLESDKETIFFSGRRKSNIQFILNKQEGCCKNKETWPGSGPRGRARSMPFRFWIEGILIIWGKWNQALDLADACDCWNSRTSLNVSSPNLEGVIYEYFSKVLVSPSKWQLRNTPL